jgi:hypothetical protein
MVQSRWRAGAGFLYQVLSMRCNAKPQTARKLNKQPSSATGTLIANTEFCFLSTNRRGDYAKQVSRGPVEYAAAVS